MVISGVVISFNNIYSALGRKEEKNTECSVQSIRSAHKGMEKQEGMNIKKDGGKQGQVD